MWPYPHETADLVTYAEEINIVIQRFWDFHDVLKHSPFELDSHLPKKCFIYLNGSPSKITKNAFYFVLKALFFHRLFQILSWLFGHVEKTAWLER